MSRHIPLGGLVAVVCLSSTLHAQVCAGRAPLSNGRFRFGGEYSNYPAPEAGAVSGNQVGATFGFAQMNGAFGSVGASRFSYNEDASTPSGIGHTAKVLTLGVGFPMIRSADKTAAICPVGGVDAQSGPDGTFTFLGTTFDAHSSALRGSLGAAGGVQVPLSETVVLVPYLDLRYSKVRASATLTSGSTSDTQHETIAMGLVEAGAGFVINKSLTIRPSWWRNFGLGSDTKAQNVYAVGVAWSFGKAIRCC